MWSDAGPWSVSSLTHTVTPDSDHRPGNCCVSVTSPGSGCGLDTPGSGLAAQLQTGLCVQSSGQASPEKLDRFGLVAASSKENSYNFV